MSDQNILKLFKVTLGFERKPYFLAVEAKDFGDAQGRAALFDSRTPTSIEELSRGGDWELVTHWDVLNAQDRISAQEMDEREEMDDRDEPGF